MVLQEHNLMSETYSQNSQINSHEDNCDANEASDGVKQDERKEQIVPESFQPKRLENILSFAGEFVEDQKQE